MKLYRDWDIESKYLKRKKGGFACRRFFCDRLIEAILAFLPGITSGGSSIPLNERFFAGANIDFVAGRSKAATVKPVTRASSSSSHCSAKSATNRAKLM